MKKAYKKPEIMFEDFSLNTSIAGTCERIVGNPTVGVCAIEGTGGVSVFSGEMTACEFTPESFNQAADQWDGFCYHVPTTESNLFNS